jgi:hypothetical protein
MLLHIGNNGEEFGIFLLESLIFGEDSVNPIDLGFKS